MLPWKPKPAAWEEAAGASPQAMGTDGYPGVGAQAPHEAGSVQGHHIGLSPPAGGAGGGGRVGKASRGGRSGRMLVPLSHSATDPKEGLTTSPLSASPSQVS